MSQKQSLITTYYKHFSNLKINQFFSIFRPNHSSQQTNELYKPSRSPLSNASRYPYPPSPQIQTPVSSQVTNQRYNVPPTAYPATYRDYNRQPRISLLHSTEYANRPRESLPGGAAPVHHLEQAQGQEQQPFKKIRLQDRKEMPPLRIDTRVS